MASYEQDKKSKLWSVRFRAIEYGREINKRLSGYKRQKDAKDAYLEFMSSYAANKNQAGELLFVEVYKKYLETLTISNKDSTQVDKIGVYNNFILSFFKNTKLKQLNKALLYEWQTNLWLTKQKNGTQYAYSYLMKIRSFLNHFLNYVEDVYEINNKLSLIKPPKNIEVKKQMLFWEFSEFDKFIKSIDDDIVFKTLFMFQFYTGNRIGETLALKDSDIKNNKVIITKSLTRKTIDNALYKISTTKNYKTRETPLPDALQQQLKLFFDWKHKNKISSKFLFLGSGPLAENTIKRRLEKYARLSGVKVIRVHDLRHSYVSMLVHLGESTKVIAELIGDTEEQVIKTYSHMYSNDKNRAINAINKNFRT